MSATLVERMFYCCWCSTRKPVESGYVEMSRRRKKCRACQAKLKERQSEQARAR